ncbi:MULTISPECIES: GrpB family protein [Providencia]
MLIIRSGQLCLLRTPLRTTLEKKISRIYHIGSTSVHGMRAKSVINISL